MGGLLNPHVQQYTRGPEDNLDLSLFHPLISTLYFACFSFIVLTSKLAACVPK